MTGIVKDRNGCALQGARALLGAIDGVVPVLHANAGCSVAQGSVDGLRANGVPSTALLEKQVVFGGTARLREQLKNTLQVRAGALYVVLSGCVPEVIGDDIPAMLKEAREQRFPSFALPVPGFRGHGWSGYAAAARALVEQAPAVLGPPADAPAVDVNLLGPAPGLDASWDADLQEIEALLALAGVRSRRLVGFGQGIADWQAAARARLTVVLSPWAVDAARWLESHHGIPVLDAGWLPVGSRATGALLARVGTVLGVADATIAAARTQLDRRLGHVLHRAAGEGVLDALPASVGVVAPSASAVGIARFLAETLGVGVDRVVITDAPPETRRAELLAALTPAGAPPPLYAESQPDIDAALRAAAPELVIGSSFEAAIARSLGAAHVEAVAPSWRQPALERPLAGVRGALALTEVLLAAMRTRGQQATVPAWHATTPDHRALAH